MIPVANHSAQAKRYWPEIRGAIGCLLPRGHYNPGREVKAMKREFAAHIGESFAIGVANGTDANTSRCAPSTLVPEMR